MTRRQLTGLTSGRHNKHYSYIWDNLSGTSLIVRRKDEYTTLRNTGVEANEEREAISNMNVEEFLTYCEGLEFTQ